MKGDIPLVAFRLMQQLPVTTHRADEPVSKTTAFIRARREALSYRLPKPIKVFGRQFASINEARNTLHLSSVTIDKMLEDGRAEYV
jgi:hypothetical protein